MIMSSRPTRCARHADELRGGLDGKAGRHAKPGCRTSSIKAPGRQERLSRIPDRSEPRSGAWWVSAHGGSFCAVIHPEALDDERLQQNGDHMASEVPREKVFQHKVRGPKEPQKRSGATIAPAWTANISPSSANFRAASPDASRGEAHAPQIGNWRARHERAPPINGPCPSHTMLTWTLNVLAPSVSGNGSTGDRSTRARPGSLRRHPISSHGPRAVQAHWSTRRGIEHQRAAFSI